MRLLRKENSETSYSMELDQHVTNRAEELVRKYNAETNILRQTAVNDLVATVRVAFSELTKLAESKQASKRLATNLVLEHDENSISVSISFSRQLGLIPHDVFSQHSHQRIAQRGKMNDEWFTKVHDRVDRIIVHERFRHYVLEFIQYLRPDGQERLSWYLTQFPRLATGISLEPENNGTADDLTAGIVRESKAEEILQLDAVAFYAARQFDGKVSLQDIYMSCIGQFGLVPPEKMLRLYEQLEAIGYLETQRSRAHGVHRKRLSSDAFNLNASIAHPDRIVKRFHGLSRRCINFIGTVILIAIGTSGVFPLFHSWGKLTEIYLMDFHGFHTFANSIIAAYVISLAGIMIHELAHGVVCKHFGGKIHQLGVTFYMGSLMFYCDTTSSWKFPDKAQRIYVSLGGPLVSYVLLGLSLWMFWLASSPFWVGVWYIFAFISLIGLIMNFNPFIRMDTYYVLMDWLEIPNLRPRSFAYLREVAGNLFGSGKKVESNRSTAREKRIFWLYGMLGILVSVALVGWAIEYYVRALMRGDWLHAHIYLVMAFLALTLIRLASGIGSQVYASHNAEIILK
ncbi:MAG: hypothetical protein AAGJ81_13675 [Verrucomicrobiota bacterium]